MAQLLLDTNVVLRSLHKESPEHSIVQRAISRLIQNGDELFLTTQVCIELWAVATRPIAINGLGWQPALVKSEIEGLIAQFPFLAETPDLLSLWLKVVSEHGVSGKRTHDARLVAVMKAHGVSHLLTFNGSDFQNFHGIKVIDPKDIATT